MCFCYVILNGRSVKRQLISDNNLEPNHLLGVWRLFRGGQSAALDGLDVVDDK